MRRSWLPSTPPLPSFRELVYRVKAAELVHRESQIPASYRVSSKPPQASGVSPGSRARRTQEYPASWRGTSLRLDARLTDHRPPLVDLRLVVRAQGLGRLLLGRHDLLAEVGELLAHL